MNIRTKAVIAPVAAVIVSLGVIIMGGNNIIADAPTAETTKPVVYISTTVDATETTKPVTKPATTVTTTKVVTEPKLIGGLTEEEIDLIALVTMAEAEGEPELGKRLVIDTILNRVDDPRFPDTVHGVVYQPNQFEAMWNGRVDRCDIRDGIRQLVVEEAEDRANEHVIFFRTDHYHPYGTPMFSIGNHYFSEYD